MMTMTWTDYAEERCAECGQYAYEICAYSDCTELELEAAAGQQSSLHEPGCALGNEITIIPAAAR